MRPLKLAISYAAVCTFFAQVASSAPTGYWSFEESSGATAIDGSGNGLNATLFGSPIRSLGHVGTALEFDGSSTYGKVVNSTLLDGTDQLTISFWVRPTGLDGSAQFIVSKRASTTTEQAFALFFGTDNKLFFDLNRSGNSGRFESNTIFENDRWYAITLVYDGTTNLSQRARLYVDGRLDRQAPVPSSTIPHKNSDLFIGIGNAGYPIKFRGMIDELKISRNIPTSAEMAEAHRGTWLLERYYNHQYDEVEKLIADPKYYAPPSVVQYLSDGGVDVELPYRGVRMRGLLEVPATGNYVFWLSASASAELYLSNDSLPFGKKRVAKLSQAIGTDAGIKLSEPNRWDKYDSQMSEPFHLEAGAKYYIEIAGQTNHAGTGSHFHLAWAPEGGLRTPIPGSALSYYVIDPTDHDDDSLPDSWESANGLDLMDNGASDVAKQGERGDFDGDGLTNREEYLLGTNPDTKDTDGDGRSDFDEVHSYHSNPLVSDAPTEAIVSTVDLNDIHSASSTWTMIEGGLISESFRGAIEWNFDVPTDGVWLLQAATRLRGTVYDHESLDVGVFIDGRDLGRYSLDYGANHEALLRIVTPRLLSGRHRIRLDIDNIIARRTVQIVSLDVRQPAGPDMNINGTPDWVEELMAQSNHLATNATTSRISPYCLEGSARLAQEVTVNGNAVLRGVDETHWFTNLPLHPSLSTPFSVDFGNGLSAADSLFWQSTNILDGGTLPVRLGDSIKLGAWVADGTGSAVVTVAHPYPALPSGYSGGLLQNTDARSGGAALQVPVSGGKHIRLSDSDELDGTDKLTISFWAKPNVASLDGLPRGIVSKRVANNSEVAWSVFMYTGGRLFVDIDAAGTAPLRVDTGYAMTSDWQKVEVVYDGTLIAAQRLKVYVDGTLRKTASVPTTSLRNLASDVCVGTLNNGYVSNGASVTFGGLLDDIRITRGISATESTTVRLDFENVSDLGAQTNSKQATHIVDGTQSIVQAFSEKGVYMITAVHSGGSSNSLSVPVRIASFSAPIPVLKNTLRYWNLDANLVDPYLAFQPGSHLGLGIREIVDATHFRFSLYPEIGGRLGVAARLWDNGPIVGVAEIQSVAISDALQNDVTITTTSADFPGYNLVITPITVTGLPPGGYVKITMYKAGTMFLDGSKILILNDEDFVNGVYELKILHPADDPSGYCHYLDLYDSQGNLIGRR